MKNRLFATGALVLVLMFGMTVIGCNNDSSDDSKDTWSKATSFSQVNGRWKAPPSYSATSQGMTFSGTTNNYIITFNAAKKTMSVSGSTTVTISGRNIDEYWADQRTSLEYMNQQDGITVTINDTKHSYTVTYNNVSQTLTDQQLSSILGIQINQNASKLKMASEGIEKF